MDYFGAKEGNDCTTLKVYQITLMHLFKIICFLFMWILFQIKTKTKNCGFQVQVWSQTLCRITGSSAKHLSLVVKKKKYLFPKESATYPSTWSSSWDFGIHILPHRNRGPGDRRGDKTGRGLSFIFKCIQALWPPRSPKSLILPPWTLLFISRPISPIFHAFNLVPCQLTIDSDQFIN